MSKMTGLTRHGAIKDEMQDKRTNVIQLADQANEKAHEVLRFSIAKALNTSVECVVDAMMKNASSLMAKVPDGYALYRYGGMMRAALIVNMEVCGQNFPFIYHSDDGESDPVGLLYADMEHEYLGAFIDYILPDENLHLYHAVARYLPEALGGIGFIQAIYNAKQGKVLYYDGLDIRRVCKLTVAQLQH